jgi:transposase
VTIYPLNVRVVKRIPTNKDLLKTLRQYIFFRMDSEFTLAEKITSVASYSRLIEKVSRSDVFEQIQGHNLIQALDKSFVTNDTIAINATHIDGRDQEPTKEGQQKSKRKCAANMI